MTDDDVEAVARALEPEAYDAQSAAYYDALRAARIAIATLEERGWQPPTPSSGLTEEQRRKYMRRYLKMPPE